MWYSAFLLVPIIAMALFFLAEALGESIRGNTFYALLNAYFCSGCIFAIMNLLR